MNVKVKYNLHLLIIKKIGDKTFSVWIYYHLYHLCIKLTYCEI